MNPFALPTALIWLIWLGILLMELATPPTVVFGILYVVPLLLGAAQRTTRQAWRFLLICCASTLSNLLVPLPVNHNLAAVLIDRLLVCLALGVITVLLVRNRELQRQRIALPSPTTSRHRCWAPWPRCRSWEATLWWRPSAPASSEACA
ncbi:MAG: hypothetical protein ACKO22_04215 [Cyanobium sp.]